MILSKNADPSTRADKKWMAERDGKRVHFGARGYDDYTTHKDPERRLYILRHLHEDYSNPMSPAWLSRYLLWEKPHGCDPRSEC